MIDDALAEKDAPRTIHLPDSVTEVVWRGKTIPLAAPQDDSLMGIASSETPSAHPDGAAPGLPDYPKVRRVSLQLGGSDDMVFQTDYDALRTLALRAVEQRDGLLRGEYICKECGIRKDSKQEPPTW